MSDHSDFETLWEDVLDKYIDSTSRTQAEQELLKAIKSPEDLEKRLQRNKEKFISFRSKHGKLSRGVQKVLRPFTTLSTVASSALSLTPFAPASVVFGAVVFIIEAADGVSEAYDWIESFFDKLTDFTIRLEEYCRQDMGSRLTTKVVEILGCVLDIFARSEKAIKTGRWKRYTAIVFLGKDGEIKASFEKLRTLFEEEQQLVTAIDFATNQRVDLRTQEIQETGNQTFGVVTDMRKEFEESARIKRHHDILEWISPIDFASQQADSLNRREKGTTGWFIETPEFNAWTRGEKQTLYCTGMPGAGKTIIAATAIEHLQKTVQRQGCAVSYIYCSYQRRAENSVPVLIAAIIRQLAHFRIV